MEIIVQFKDVDLNIKKSFTENQNKEAHSFLYFNTVELLRLKEKLGRFPTNSEWSDNMIRHA